MGSPRHLWTGEWRAESDQARDEGASAFNRTPPARPAEEQAPPPDRPPRRRAGLIVGLLVVALAIAGGAFAAGMLLDDGGGDAPEPLPAVSSRPIRPAVGQTRAGAIYAAASPAVVSVRTSTGQGTGFLIDDAGTIVTNQHVVGGSSTVVVKFGQDGVSIDGDVLGADESTDLAVVSIERNRIPRGVRPLRFSDSRNVAVGDYAIAIGNPFGLDRTATEGIVSGIGRSISAPNGFQIDEVIQTDAPINPGNSGGPLLDSGGRVIGVNSQIVTGGLSQGNVGIGFAVPSNTARVIVPQLKEGKTIPRPYLGVQTTPTAVSASHGARVSRLYAGAPAARAGLREGDVITSIDGRAVDSPEDVVRIVSRKAPGDKVEVEFERGGRAQSVTVTLGTRPARMP